MRKMMGTIPQKICSYRQLRGISLLLFFTICAAAQAQTEPIISSEVDTTAIKIGEQIQGQEIIF